MNAPEKIYLTSDENNSFVFTQKRSDNKGIEYTRTDAFIEKMCEWLEDFNNNHYIMRYSDSCEITKEELIEGMKKYLEIMK